MYIINLILVFRLSLARTAATSPPTLPSVTSTGLNGPMKQECAVSLSPVRVASRLRLSSSSLLSLPLPLAVCTCTLCPPPPAPPSTSLLSPSRVILAPSLFQTTDSDPAQHKRVINYLRVGHVFPSCSPSPSPSVSFPPFPQPTLSLPLPSTSLSTDSSCLHTLSYVNSA